MFQKNEMVWCRPRLIDEPIHAKYVRKISDAERKEGYRAGHVVEIDGLERWVRLDLCSLSKESVKDVKQ